MYASEIFQHSILRQDASVIKLLWIIWLQIKINIFEFFLKVCDRLGMFSFEGMRITKSALASL